jgi:hypothetical protein
MPYKAGRIVRLCVQHDGAERPKVDRTVLDFVSHVFDAADFVIRGDGACRLNPEMARMSIGFVSGAVR